MKRNVLYLIIVLFAAIAATWSCQRTNTLPKEPIVYVSASIQGRVLDENKMPVNGAIVTAGTATANTDVNGNFTINNVELEQQTGYVTVQKTGYFMGSRTFVVNAGVANKVQVELIKKVSVGSFTVSAGGTMNLPSGGSINFPTGAVINPVTNTLYNGSVDVAAFLLNPTAPDFAEIMPGDLRGINSNNQETGLQSFGMMAVELAGSNGEKLQLAPGKMATLQFPIPSSLQAQAPATIPLWFFDESKGIWKEEGSATKQGTQYIGTVSHFSFWNVDVPYQLIDFTATLKDKQGNAVQFARVIINTKGDTTSISGSGNSDVNGKVSGKIPANRALQLSVYNSCDKFIYSQDIGPFTAAANLGIISLDHPNTSVATISGTVVNCNNVAVTNGYVNIFLDGIYQRASINNGNFSLSISRCSNVSATASITAVDLAGNVFSAVNELVITEGIASTGQIRACGNLATQFINFTIGDSSYALLSPGDSLNHSRFNFQSIYGYSLGTNDKYVSIGFGSDTTIGSTTLTSANFSVNGRDYVKNGVINMTITEYGRIHEFIVGNFTGILRDSSNSSITVPVNCNYKVRRSR